MRGVLWSTYFSGRRKMDQVLNRFLREERGDQNIGSLGLIVVTMLIVGFLVKTFVPAVTAIFDSVIVKMKEYLKVT